MTIFSDVPPKIRLIVEKCWVVRTLKIISALLNFKLSVNKLITLICLHDMIVIVPLIALPTLCSKTLIILQTRGYKDRKSALSCTRIVSVTT